MQNTAISAKMSVMMSKLLKYTDYSGMAGLKTVEDIGNELHEREAYTGSIDLFTDTALHRSQIERVIIQTVIDDYERVSKFVCDAGIRSFLNALILKNDIYLLKLIITMIYDERVLSFDITELEILSKKKLSFDIKKMQNVKTIPDFIEKLYGTPFYSPLSGIYRDDITLFELEIKLDIYYYTNLWKCQNKYLKETDKKIINELTGTEIDLRNISWIYRYKTYYDMDRSVILANLIPIRFKLSNALISSLAEAKSLDALQDGIRNCEYNSYATENNLEKAFDNELIKLHMKHAKNFNSLAPVVVYFFLKHLEIKNLISLVEGVRYKLSPNEIMGYLSIAR